MSISSNHNNINDSNTNIVGNFNYIQGHNNNISGNHNHIRSERSKIVGDYNKIYSDNNTIVGKYNEINGNNNTIVGDYNTIRGQNNRVVTGHNNRGTFVNEPNGFYTASSYPYSDRLFGSIRDTLSHRPLSPLSPIISLNSHRTLRSNRSIRPRTGYSRTRPFRSSFVIGSHLDEFEQLERIETDAFSDTFNNTTVRLEVKEDDKPEVEKDTCILCYDNKKSVIFLPCAHITSCNKCSQTIIEENQKCPICREVIVDMKNIII